MQYPGIDRISDIMHDPNLIPKKHEFGILFGQKPLTKFKDYRKSIKVDLIKYDDREQMLKGTYDFAKATWSVDGRESDDATEEEMKDALAQMIGGKALGLGLETINLMFRMSGINRIDTHQIVRQRIGVTFSQMCSGGSYRGMYCPESYSLKGDNRFNNSSQDDVCKSDRLWISFHPSC